MTGKTTTSKAAFEKYRSHVNTPKHALINIVRSMRTEGSGRKADSLENIIRSLEEWQNR